MQFHPLSAISASNYRMSRRRNEPLFAEVNINIDVSIAEECSYLLYLVDIAANVARLLQAGRRPRNCPEDKTRGDVLP